MFDFQFFFSEEESSPFNLELLETNGIHEAYLVILDLISLIEVD